MENKLWNSVIMEDYDTLKSLISNGASFSFKREKILRYFVYKNNLEMVKFLIDHSANVNINNDECLKIAVNNGSVKMVELLIDNGADSSSDDYFIYYYSLRLDHIQIVKYLLNKYKNCEILSKLLLISIDTDSSFINFLIDTGADINYKDGLPLIKSIQSKNFKIMDKLLKHGANPNCYKGEPLLQAINMEEIFMVEKLLKHKADPNIDGGYPLILSVKNNLTDIAEYLLINKADPNASDCRPMQIAVDNCYESMVNILLEYGANPYYNHGEFLIRAIIKNNKNIALSLIKKGVSVNGFGDTPLINAVKYNRINITDMLLKWGANPDYNDCIAIKIATNEGHYDILNLLLKRSQYVNTYELLDMAINKRDIRTVKTILEYGLFDKTKKKTPKMTDMLGSVLGKNQGSDAKNIPFIDKCIEEKCYDIASLLMDYKLKISMNGWRKTCEDYKSGNRDTLDFINKCKKIGLSMI